MYDLFGADKKGNLISIITKEQPESNSNGSRIKIKSNKSKSIMYDKLVFIWQCYNGLKPEDKTVINTSDSESDDELDNLQLIDISKRNKIVATKWKNKQWTCPDCGFQTKNNAKRHHERMCEYSAKRYSEEELNRLIETRKKWRNNTFNCQICGNEYKNYYKTVHTALCEKKNNGR